MVSVIADPPYMVRVRKPHPPENVSLARGTQWEESWLKEMSSLFQTVDRLSGCIVRSYFAIDWNNKNKEMCNR